MASEIGGRLASEIGGRLASEIGGRLASEIGRRLSSEIGGRCDSRQNSQKLLGGRKLAPRTGGRMGGVDPCLTPLIVACRFSLKKSSLVSLSRRCL